MAVKVFISSTYIDLKDHRQRVITQLRRAGYQVDPMEDWTSDADEPKRFSLDRLDGCQACVLLVGFRRGFIPAGQARSITQMEYDRAIARGIDILPFLLDDEVARWPDSYDDRAKDPQLKTWREDLGLHHGVERFAANPTSVDVLPAFSRWQARQYEREQVQDYLASIRTAHGAIRFLGLPTLQDNQDMQIDRLFVEPQLSEHPIDPERDPSGWRARRPIGEVMAGANRLVILGDPGSGKSTMVDWIAWQLADEFPNAWKVRFGSRIPIPLILRDLHLTQGITWDGLLDAFLAHPIGRHLSHECCLRLMEEGHVLVMLDGLDEVGNLQTRRDLRDAVRTGLRRFSQCPALFTSRVIGYDDVPFHVNPDPIRVVRSVETDSPPPQPFAMLTYMAPFDDTQIGQFAQNWYAVRETDADKARQGAEQLVQAVHRDQDTLRLARVPNLLTMMALIHRNRATLPNGKALLYEDITQAYLKTIDEFRQITEYTDTLQDMKRWLSEVGFKMQLRSSGRRVGTRTIRLNGHTLRSWLGAAMAGTDRPAAAVEVRRFLDIIKRRSGLMIELGENLFAFIHLSFQEYFAAVYLADWVTSAEWLLGEEVPPGTAAADLQQYGADPTWEETLVFLFELLAGAKPLGKRKIREAVFGPDWSTITGVPERQPQTASLLARLTSDPHINWDPDTLASAVDRCLDIIAGYHHGADATDLREKTMAILRPLFSSEPATCLERLQQLVNRWASTGISKLVLFQTPVADLSPLARLSGLRMLSLENTLVVDLSPLAQLSGLIALSLENTLVVDLSPLAQLSGLRMLSLENTLVTKDEVAKLRARMPGLKVFGPH